MIHHADCHHNDIYYILLDMQYDVTDDYNYENK